MCNAPDGPSSPSLLRDGREGGADVDAGPFPASPVFFVHPHLLFLLSPSIYQNKKEGRICFWGPEQVGLPKKYS